MEVVEYIFCVLTCIFFIVTVFFTIFYVSDKSDVSLIGGLISFICCVICIAGADYWAERNNNSDSNPELAIHEYPLDEWKMDYKITSVCGKTDTTVVLTKIK